MRAKQGIIAKGTEGIAVTQITDFKEFKNGERFLLLHQFILFVIRIFFYKGDNHKIRN